MSTSTFPGHGDIIIEGGRVISPGGLRRRDVAVSGGRVVDDLPDDRRAGARRIDASGLLVGPGLIDLQVNGADGVDLTSDPRSWDRVAAAMARHATTTFCPTIVTAPEPAILDALEVLDAARRSDHPLSAMLLGAHVEGPFISASRAGAHDPSVVRPIAAAEVGAWLTAGGVAIVTLAPELTGATALTARLVDAGVIVSMGHSDATEADALAGLEAGARMVTHLFNAMAPFHHRDTGLAGVALTDPRPVVTLIADGVHLDRRAVELAWTALGVGRRCLVSDATSAAALGAPPTRSDTVGGTLGGMSIEGDGRSVRTPGGTLAGSTMFLLDAVRWLVDSGIAPLEEAWQAASATPAALLGLDDHGWLKAGDRANIVVLDDGLTPLVTLLDGVDLSSWRPSVDGDGQPL